MESKMTAKISTVGFKPSEIRPRKMWTRLQEDFLELYNDYCEISNERIPSLNKFWEDAHPCETEDNDEKELTEAEQTVKDLKDYILGLKYANYMRDAFDQCAFEANQKHPDSYLSGCVLMVGETTPVFAVRIKQHPEMYMTFAIEK